MEPIEGKELLHYKVISKLGSGGMGVVYEAEDKNLGRRVALKFLPPEMAEDSVSLERFQREARAASALNHPGICAVYAIEQHDEQHFIVMELLEGQSLSSIIKKESMEPAPLIDLAIQLADALESAHAKGIVHRDIKPMNIFVSPQGRAKILDFGSTSTTTIGPIPGSRGPTPPQRRASSLDPSYRKFRSLRAGYSTRRESTTRRLRYSAT